MFNTICLLLLLPVAGPQVVEDLTVLDGGSSSGQRRIDWSDPGLMLVHHLNGLTRACLAEREEVIGKLKSAEDWEKRQAEVRQTLGQILALRCERQLAGGWGVNGLRPARFVGQHRA